MGRFGDIPVNIRVSAFWTEVVLRMKKLQKKRFSIKNNEPYIYILVVVVVVVVVVIIIIIIMLLVIMMVMNF